MVVLAYLGAVANEFICNEWERKGMHTDVLFLCLVQYGTRGRCSSFFYNNFFVTLLKCRFMLTAVFNSTLESVPCQNSNM